MAAVNMWPTSHQQTARRGRAINKITFIAIIVIIYLRPAKSIDTVTTSHHNRNIDIDK